MDKLKKIIIILIIIISIITILLLIPKKSKIIYCPEKPNSREFIMDITNAKEELGYEPKYNYIEYLQDFKKEMEKGR